MFTQLIAHKDLTAFTYVIKVMCTCNIKNVRMPNSVVCHDAACSVYWSSSWPLLFENSMLIRSFDECLTEGNLCHHEIIHTAFISCLPANLSLNWVKTHTHVYIYIYILFMHACVPEKICPYWQKQYTHCKECCDIYALHLLTTVTTTSLEARSFLTCYTMATGKFSAHTLDITNDVSWHFDMDCVQLLHSKYNT
jgi:hypothetical protein